MSATIDKSGRRARGARASPQPAEPGAGPSHRRVSASSLDKGLLNGTAGPSASGSECAPHPDAARIFHPPTSSIPTLDPDSVISLPPSHELDHAVLSPPDSPSRSAPSDADRIARPPDNYIPTLDPDNAISLPPPHETSRPVSPVVSPPPLAGPSHLPSFQPRSGSRDADSPSIAYPSRKANEGQQHPTVPAPPGVPPLIPGQQFYAPPVVLPYSRPGSIPYSGTASGPSTPYQRVLPGTPQMHASPAPMSTYIPSPPLRSWPMNAQSPAAYPAASVTTGPYPPPSVTASPAYLAGRPSVPQSTRPHTTGATSQSIYGGPQQTYPPERMSTQSQFGPTPSAPPQQPPVTPGAPDMSQAIPLPQYPARLPTRKATDVFVANDPFKASSHVKRAKKDDEVTFDDIPVAGQPGGGPSQATPYWSAPYYATPSWTTPQWQPPVLPTPVSRPSQGVDPVVGHSNTAYPGDQSSAPQGPVPIPSGSRPSTPADSAERLNPQIPTQSGDVPLADQPDVVGPFIPPAPEFEAAPGRDEGVGESPDNPNGRPGRPERPVSPEGRQSSEQSEYYNPYRPSSPYHPDTGYGPYPFIPNEYVYPDFASPNRANRPYYYDYPSAKESFWSKLGSLVSLPFRRSKPRPPRPYMQYGQDGVSDENEKGTIQTMLTFVVRTLPSQVYLHLLLRLPALYFSRVARIFEEADLTLPEIKKMALETASQGKANIFDFQVFELQNVPPQYERLKSTWESFIDSVMREWKTYNIISVLLLSAILTILQIDSASNDPITRYTALFSLICALMSLLFGCMYIIRFGTMRKTYKAAEWALEAKKTKTIWWNVWVLLAMPAIWLTWSIVLYIACIMSFIWRTAPGDEGPSINASHESILIIRIVISTVLGVGVIYGWLVLSTFRRYGTAMDKAWKRRIDGWIEEKGQFQSATPYPYSTPYYGPSAYPPQSTPYAYPPVIPPYPDGFQPYPDPKGGYGFSEPAYPGTPYARPPEVYASSEPSEEDNATDDATRTNTLYNAQPAGHDDGSHHRPDPVSESPLPLPLKIPLSPSESTPTRAPLAVPPPPSLPPIPGTPATPFIPPSSPYSPSTEGQPPNPALGLDLGERSLDQISNHVHFRSPLLSAQPSAAGGSDADDFRHSDTGSPGLGPNSGLPANHDPPMTGLSRTGKNNVPSGSPKG